MTHIIDTKFTVTPFKEDSFLIETVDQHACITLSKEDLERLISSDAHVDPDMKTRALTPVVYHDKSIYVFKLSGIYKGSRQQLREAYRALNRTQYEVGQLWKDSNGTVRIVQKAGRYAIQTAVVLTPPGRSYLRDLTVPWHGDPAQELGWTLVS